MEPNEAMKAMARPIPGLDGYLATEDGNIISLRGKVPHVMSPGRHEGGYRQLVIARKCYKVPALVCAAFHGPRPEGQLVRHLDGSKDNDRPENLRWGTASDNVRDAVRHGTHSGPENGRKSAHKIRGEGHGLAKMTWDKVRELRARRRAGETYVAMARDYGVDCTTVGRIARNEMWIEEDANGE